LATDALELRIRAHKLWSVALEGKAEALEEKEKRMEQDVEGRVKQAESRLSEYQKEKKRSSDDKRRKNRIELRRQELGSGNENELKDNLQLARRRVQDFHRWAQRNANEIKNYESQVELLEEKTDQLEDELKLYKKGRKIRR
ncbi:MAG: hypothetical protein AAF492_24035, partial [Verrucomicrobiota bacterium]